MMWVMSAHGDFEDGIGYYLNRDGRPGRLVREGEQEADFEATQGFG